MTQIVQLIGEREAGALFETIEDALRFAFESTERGAGQGTLARLQKPRGGPVVFDDRLERVGTRGVIRRRLETLSDLHQAILVARFAPRSFPCSCRSECCSGRRRNREWAEAVGAVVSAAGAATDVEKRGLVEGAVKRWCGAEKVDLGLLADRCGVHRNTAGKHAKAVTKWLHETELGALNQAALCF
jgi:hypothetical protein